jgi:hypothetical protein
MKSEMRENVIEKRLVREVKNRGGICEKWTSGTAGWPDRIVLLPYGRTAFIEVKAPGQKPRALQKYRHEQIRKLGFEVYVLDSIEKIGGILDGIQTT